MEVNGDVTRLLEQKLMRRVVRTTERGEMQAKEEESRENNVFRFIMTLDRAFSAGG